MELMAPGINLILPWNRNSFASGVRVASGTSFAAPLAAAVALVAAQAHPTWDAHTLRQELRDHARKLPGMGGANWTQLYGYGMADAIRVVDQIH